MYFAQEPDSIVCTTPYPANLVPSRKTTENKRSENTPSVLERFFNKKLLDMTGSLHVSVDAAYHGVITFQFKASVFYKSRVCVTSQKRNKMADL